MKNQPGGLLSRIRYAHAHFLLSWLIAGL